MEVRGDEAPTVQCTSFDVKGDTSVPPYDDALIQSQRESREVSVVVPVVVRARRAIGLNKKKTAQGQ